MKKTSKILSLALCLALLVGTLAVPAHAAGATTQDKASAMKELGLFKGTDKGFELSRQPTRMEGLVMLIRLLGAEQEALSENNPHPFIDVPSLATAYAGYAYCQGLASGVSQNTFGANNTMKAVEYVTLLLRVLGYDDSNGDFTWNQSMEKACEIGMLSQEQAAQFTNQSTTRGTLVELSWAALLQPLKDDSQTLAASLIEGGVFSQEQAVQLGLLPRSVGTVDTLVKAEIASYYYSEFDLMTLDGDDNLIYYDTSKDEIIRVYPDTKETEVLLNVEDAACTTETDKGTVTYQGLEVRQIIWDHTRNALMIRGIFRYVAADKDGWTPGSGVKSTLEGLFQLKDKTMEYVAYLGLLDHILTVMRNGNYVVAGSGLCLVDSSTGNRLSSLNSSDSAYWRAAQIGQDLYVIRDAGSSQYYKYNGSLLKYDYATDSWTYITVVDSKYGIYVRDDLFYCWAPGRITATKPSGEHKIVCDLSNVIVNDMLPLPEVPEQLFVTADKQFIFYDESAKAIRMLSMP